MPACMNGCPATVSGCERVGSCRGSFYPNPSCAGRHAATQASNRAVAYANARAWTSNSLHNGRGDVR
jgi:hypothetical protein